ncbi:MAG: hypothetical protein V1934_01855 [Methanobacteriota archaeon]
MNFAVVKCCSAEAYDAIPQALVKVDIGKALSSLKAKSWREVADAGIMCVVEKEGVEATLYSSGRILVKTVESAIAEKAAKDIYDTIAV